MTTEDDFQKALDMDPTDWQTRLVFADWLQDRDDSRAAGYRELGGLRLYPEHVKVTAWYRIESWSYWTLALKPELLHAVLPKDWWNRWAQLIVKCPEFENWAVYYGYRRPIGGKYRRGAEDHAALAYSRMLA